MANKNNFIASGCCVKEKSREKKETWFTPKWDPSKRTEKMKPNHTCMVRRNAEGALIPHQTTRRSDNQANLLVHQICGLLVCPRCQSLSRAAVIRSASTQHTGPGGPKSTASRNIREFIIMNSFMYQSTAVGSFIYSLL